MRRSRNDRLYCISHGVGRRKPQLHQAQSAYRRNRGTGTLLAELADFVGPALLGTQFCDAVQFDISGAPDNVLRWNLVEASKKMEIDAHIRRVVHNWMQGRAPRLENRAPGGTRYTPILGISKGLPHWGGRGGLSPLPRLILRDRVCPALAGPREELGPDPREHLDLIYADGLTLGVRSASAEDLAELARRHVTFVEQIYWEMTMRLNHKKTRNIVFGPSYLPKGVCGRRPAARPLPTKRRSADRHRLGPPRDIPPFRAA